MKTTTCPIPRHAIRLAHSLIILARQAEAKRICRYAIRRIEYPMHGEPVILSATDKADAEAAGIAALAKAGFFALGKLPEKPVSVVMNAMENRDCLRRNCSREYGGETFDKAAATASNWETGTAPRLSLAMTRESRAIMRALRKARAADVSRKAESNFRTQRNFFIMTLSHVTGRKARDLSGNAYSVAAIRFRDYLANGYRHASAQAEAENLANPAAAISAALAAAALS